jgi:hypothetical protein
MKTTFTISNILRTSWSALLSQIWILAGLLIGYILLCFVLGAVLSFILPSSWLGETVTNLLNLIISSIFGLGYLKNLFQTLDGDEPRFSAYGQQAHKIVTYIVSGFLYVMLILVACGIFIVPYFYLLSRFPFLKEFFAGLNHMPVLPEGETPTLILAALGALFLLLPALYLSIRFMFYQAFIVEDNAGIIESLRKSWRITEEHTLRLFLLGLVMAGIGIAGFLLFIVGIFVAAPLILLVQCCVFRKLNHYYTSSRSDISTI